MSGARPVLRDVSIGTPEHAAMVDVARAFARRAAVGGPFPDEVMLPKGEDGDVVGLQPADPQIFATACVVTYSGDGHAVEITFSPTASGLRAVSRLSGEAGAGQALGEWTTGGRSEDDVLAVLAATVAEAAIVLSDVPLDEVERVSLVVDDGVPHG